jgi:endonuclease YncB( thermonuclease family)
MNDPYIRRAKELRVIDGDTFDLMVDNGFHNLVKVRVRLLAGSGGVDAPETRTKDREEKERGLVAKEFVEDWFDDAYLAAADAAEIQGPAPEFYLTIRTRKDDSFGRWLAQIWNVNGRNLGDDLLRAGLAERWSK